MATSFKFNSHPLKRQYATRSPDYHMGAALQNAVNLWHASLEDAAVYGGEATRYLLSSAPLTHTKRYTVVDVRTHELRPGQYGSEPGWHCDAGFRDKPMVQGLREQEHEEILNPDCKPIIHLLSTNAHSLTQFMSIPLNLVMLDEQAQTNSELDYLASGYNMGGVFPDIFEWVTYDWWQLHRTRPYTGTLVGHRYLIRIVESNHIPPNMDLRKVIRTHAHIYTPLKG